MYKTAAILLALTLPATLSGCGRIDNTGSAGGASACTSDQAEAVKRIARAQQPQNDVRADLAPDTIKIDKPACAYTIGVVYPHFKDPYFLANAYGVKSEAAKLGVNVRILAGQGYGDIPTQLSQLANLTTQGMHAVILAAVDSKALGPTVDRAWTSGLPVIYNEISTESRIKIGSFTNDVQSGQRQADHIAEADPNAKVIALCGPPGAAFGKTRCEAFKKRLAEKAPRAVVVTEKYHDMDRAAITQIAGNALEAFPKANWVYNSTDLQAKGAVDALKAAGRKPGETKVTCTTMGRELVSIMEQGWVTFALAERGVAQGRLALQRTVGLLNGEKLPATWYSALPGFTNSAEDLARFRATEKDLNWEPEGFRP